MEVGLGIGTIYSAVYEFNSSIKYYGTENNDFCLNSLKRNLKKSYENLNLYSSISELPKELKFDVVVVDGKDESLREVKSNLTKNAVIVIEGDRSDQEKSMLKLFPNSRSVHVITLKKNNIDGFFNPNDYQGGVKVIFINPTFKQLVYWFKNKALTSLKYKIRKLKK